MQAKKIVSIIITGIFICNTLQAQSDALPAVIDNVFYAQYPYASDIKVARKDQQTFVNFLMKHDNYLSVYEGTDWKYTLMDYNYDQLPAAVKDGYKASRYAGLKVTDTKVLYVSSGFEQYRLTLDPDKEHVNGQYLFFNENGRLARHVTVR